MNWIKGKSYKTVGGHEAIYVGQMSEHDYLFVHHERDKSNSMKGYEHALEAFQGGNGAWALEQHSEDGKFRCDDGDCDLDVTTEPWKEPRKGELWVNVYDTGFSVHESIEEADSKHEAVHRNNGIALLSRKRVSWQEGVFDE